MHKLLFIPLIIFLASFTSSVQIAGDEIIGTWMPSKGTSKVSIYRAKNGKYYGKVKWLKVTTNKDGSVRLDDNNPNKTLKTKPLLGLVMLKKFTYDASDKEYNGGTIYDPNNGKTYKCYMKLEGNDVLKVRGYVGISLLGRTDTWKRK